MHSHIACCDDFNVPGKLNSCYILLRRAHADGKAHHNIHVLETCATGNAYTWLCLVMSLLHAEHTTLNLRNSFVLLSGSISWVRSLFGRSHDALFPFMIGAKQIGTVMLFSRCTSSTRVLRDSSAQDNEYSLCQTTYHTVRSTSHHPACPSQYNLPRLHSLFYKCHNYINFAEHCDVSL